MSRHKIAVSIAICGAIASTTAIPTAAAAAPGDPQPVGAKSIYDTMRDAASRVFDVWSGDTTTSDVSFQAPNLNAQSLKWALPYTTDTNVANAVATDPDVGKQILDPKPISDFINGVDKPTPAKLPDGTGVIVLPFDKATVDNGLISLSKLVHGLTFQPDDSSSRTSAVAPDDNIRLLFDDGHGVTSSFDAAKALTPDIVTTNGEFAFLNNDGKKSVIDPATTPTIAPGETTNITRTSEITNQFGRQLTSTLKAFRTTDDATKDKADGREDGLAPLTNQHGQQVEVSDPVTNGKVTQTIQLTAPSDGGDGLIYLTRQLTDDKGRDVSPVTMDIVANTKPMMDVQASTESGSSQLKGDKDKQTVFNTVQLSQLQPMKKYQVLVNLYQCDGKDDCREIAAVNREIIPQQSDRNEHFSVDLDASQLNHDDGTFEWTTRLFEGTGNVHKMGTELASVADHPQSQVVSFNAKQQANGSESVNTKNAAHVNLTAEGEQKSVNENLPVGDKPAPASVEQIRQNNAMLENNEEVEHKKNTSMVTLLIVALVAVGMIVGWQVYRVKKTGGTTHDKTTTRKVTKRQSILSAAKARYKEQRRGK